MRDAMQDVMEHQDSPPMKRFQRVSSKAALGSTISLLAVFIISLLLLMETSSYDTWGGLFVGPLVILASLPILARQAKREADRSLFWLLVAALLVKLAGALVFHFTAYDLYDRVADAVGYHEHGVALSEQFRSGNFDHGLAPLTGTNFMYFITGIVYTLIGPTKLGGYLFFSWLGFWGLFLLYRAFTIAVPEGRARTYARLLFFLPSFAYWPSSIGKEAWVILALGVAAFGSARVLSGKTWKGLLIAGFGMWMAALIRPHIAALIGVGLGVGYLLRKPREELRQLAPVAKSLSLVVMVVVATVVVVRAERFLSDSGVETERGVTGLQNSINARTSEGGSYYPPSILKSPVNAPKAVFTVLFRPLPPEAHNTQAFLASLENTFLLLFTLWRIPWALAALKLLRRRPYIGLAFVYSALFIVAFSSVANFGTLVRQRVQVLPFFLLFLCIPPKQKEQPPESARRHSL